MIINLQYHSGSEHKSQRKKRKKPELSQLAQDTFRAFEPFINVYDCGISTGNGPFHLIPKECWNLHRRYKSGERNLTCPDGTRFNPFLHVVRNIIGPQHVQKHLAHGITTYYTSGRKGLGLLYLDIDAHESWQTDEQRAKAVLQKLFPFGFFRPSTRGQNGYLKVSYTSIEEFNRIAAVLQGVLKRLFLDLGIMCDVEVKGTISHGSKSGTLAKLPFHSPYSCNMRDETDTWNYPQLRKFQSCPTVNARRIEHLARQVASQLDDNRGRAFADHKKALKEKTKQERFEQVASAYAEGTIMELLNRSSVDLELPMPCPSCGSNRFSVGMYGYICHKCGHSIEPHVVSGKPAPVRPQIPTAPAVSAPSPPAPQKTTGQERGIRPIRASLFASHLRVQDAPSSEDAFRRNHADIKPFVRAFYQKFGKYPTTEEALDWIKANHRYSGDWDDRASKRAKRVEQILRYTQQTFDPSKLSRGGKALNLALGKFSWWVRRHFGSGMKVKSRDLRRFDAETMIAPMSMARIPARFIETFLVVADLCLKQDPLSNHAVPTNRIKKIWEMVEGGATWNQTYYQLVRDRLNRMGVIRITDKKHTAGKAWRWESGSEFPLDSWKEEEKKLKERLPSGDSEERIVSYREKKVHNTLYQNTLENPSSWVENLLVRPPPWSG